MTKAAYACPHCLTPVTAAAEPPPLVEPVWESVEGTPHPLGVSWVVHQQAWNFALYSRHATDVRLLLFSDDPTSPAFSTDLNPLRNKSGPVWHCRVARASCPEAKFFGWQVDGPAPQGRYEWHAFDPEKLLLDPCARGVFFPRDFNREAAREPGSNLGQAPLGLLNPCLCEHARPRRGRLRHGSDLVIYEAHVRGLTQHPSSKVSDSKRGTFAGLVEKIPHLTELGITAVQLMPVFQFDPDEGNYWGYMPLNFFSPHHAYSTDPDHCAQRREFRQMVDALHDAGIEVILDVVYNHTTEGNHLGPTYNLKGIDNSTYYMVTGDPDAPYANFSGCGNTLHTANRAVRHMIVDSMRHWVRDMGVDGFRFDLASVFARDSDGSINTADPPIFAQIAADPVLASVRLIAEPWDAGGAFQLGRTFPGIMWRQWNAHYRDTVQRFVRGDGGLVPDVMTRVYGSSDLFPDDTVDALRPIQSVNYFSSHDGFTLYDLVSYDSKRNWANGHNNTDGHSDYSWNCGWEGDDDVPGAVLKLRRQQAKNFLALLLVSNGTPMLRMGDEFLQTQQGNSNPYNQDNETTWLDWGRREVHEEVFRFASRMILFRKSHPSLCRSRFWRDDIHWYGAERTVDMGPRSRTLAWCLHGASVGDDDIYVLLNAGPEPVDFGIHEGQPRDWHRVVDTARPAPEDIVPEAAAARLARSDYFVQARSVVVLVRRRAD